MARRRQVTGVHQADRGPQLQYIRVQRAGQGIQHLCGVAEPAGLDQDAVRPVRPDDAIQAGGKRRGGDAAQAAASDFLDDDTGFGQQRPVDPDLAELVDQHGPALTGGVPPEQVADGAGLADAEETGDQVDGDPLHVVIRARPAAVVPRP